jgi:hypothetical protein
MATLVYNDVNMKFNGELTSCLVLGTVGSEQYVIPKNAMTDHDVAMFETLYDSVGPGSAATSGSQTANFGGAVVGGNPTGLLNDATVYTATVLIDGVNSQSINITGSAAQTFTTLVSELTTDLGVFGSASIVGGDIVITSASTGSSSTVSITDGTLFAALTGFVSFDAAVPGVDAVPALTALEALDELVLPNGTTYTSTYGMLIKKVGPKPTVPSGGHMLNRNATYWNGTSWLYLIDDTPV